MPSAVRCFPPSFIHRIYHDSSSLAGRGGSAAWGLGALDDDPLSALPCTFASISRPPLSIATVYRAAM